MDLEAFCNCISCHGQANSFGFRDRLCIVLAMLSDTNISLFFQKLWPLGSNNIIWGKPESKYWIDFLNSNILSNHCIFLSLRSPMTFGCSCWPLTTYRYKDHVFSMVLLTGTLCSERTICSTVLVAVGYTCLTANKRYGILPKHLVFVFFATAKLTPHSVVTCISECEYLFQSLPILSFLWW